MRIIVVVLVAALCLLFLVVAIILITEREAEGTGTPLARPAPDSTGNGPPAHDDNTDDGNGDTSLYAGLTCVTSERAANDTVDYVQLYHPCDNVIYSMGSTCGNVGPKAGLQAIAALGEDKVKYVGFDYDGSQDVACYASLGRIDGWEKNGYAALSVVLADDFSDVADVMAKVKFAFDAIKGTSAVDMPKIVGIKINPADADVTKENAEKLRDLLSGVSLVIFQSHPERDVVPCTIGISDALISKNNVIKLMRDIHLPVAISTTAALVLITTDGQQTERGSHCVGLNLVPRSTRCSLIGSAARDGHSVPSGFSNTVVIEYLTTASASSLLPDRSVRHRTKYGVAVFNLDYYYLDQYPVCPSLNLSAFKLPRPDKTVTAT
ncbi:uncharacterized protein [Dermacentor andersoni]|uniref:uncharacterized protein isoform X1 n=1 Tax=Dermacentor andersoni TaxID=34620 RepID=UPI002416687E|nr:uncharacterized protein LOC126527506 isoform X1 [Dermacentor andersoni]